MDIFLPKRYFDKKEDIPFEEYYRMGYRGVLFDIDNTLVPHDEPVDDMAYTFIDRLKKIGFRICLISNNDEERVCTFADPLDVLYVYKAWKPKRDGYIRGMDILGTDTDSTLFVGDQIFTDIWGANRAGIYSILLDPIDPKEEIQIVLKRIPERLIKHIYRKRNALRRNEYDMTIAQDTE